jgi:uncharacterized membrane protein YqhA
MFDRNWGIISFGSICSLAGFVGAVFGHIFWIEHPGVDAYNVLKDFQALMAALVALVVGITAYHAVVRKIDEDKDQASAIALSKANAAESEITARARVLVRMLRQTLALEKLESIIEAWQNEVGFLANKSIGMSETALGRIWASTDEIHDDSRKEVVRRLICLEDGVGFVRLLHKTINSDTFGAWTLEKKLRRIDTLAGIAYRTLCNIDMELHRPFKIANRARLRKSFENWPSVSN